MLQVGIIGGGRMGLIHTKSIVSGISDVRVRAIATPHISEQHRELADKYRIDYLTEKYTDILSDPQIDAVVICAPTAMHADICIESIHAGKHIFCEKPIDLTVERINAVKAELEKSDKNLCFMVGFNRRFDHNFKKIRDVIKNGEIGEVQFVRVSSRDFTKPSVKYIKNSGGMIMDMMIHDLDMAQYLTGESIEEVYVSGACLIDPEIGKAGDIDCATISAKLSNGALVTIDGTRQSVYGYDQRAEVFGSKGCVHCENDRPSTVVVSTVDGIAQEKPLPFFLERYMDSYKNEMVAFIEALSQKKAPIVGLDDGLLATRLVLACYLSMKEHRPVRIDEV